MQRNKYNWSFCCLNLKMHDTKDVMSWFYFPQFQTSITKNGFLHIVDSKTGCICDKWVCCSSPRASARVCVCVCVPLSLMSYKTRPGFISAFPSDVGPCSFILFFWFLPFLECFNSLLTVFCPFVLDGICSKICVKWINHFSILSLNFVSFIILGLRTKTVTGWGLVQGEPGTPHIHTYMCSDSW